MNVPNLPPDKTLVDATGKITDTWYTFFSQLIVLMQQNLSDQGIKLPQQTAETITSLNTAQSTGALLYDSTNDLLKVNIDGTFRTVTTS